MTWPYVLPDLAPTVHTDIDRASERRTDTAWVDSLWAAATTRVLVVDRDSRVPLAAGALDLRPVDGAPDGERYLLGVDGQGAAFFAVRTDTEHSDWLGLREAGPTLDDRGLRLVMHAVALANWHRTHQHCPRCGAATRLVAGGSTRVCTADGSEHFPRSDPAMIVLVVDGDDRGLLAHHHRSPAGGFTTLAGYVEPGESLEQAVVREVREEAGVTVDDIAYAGSQPWPYPSNLMLGCYARAKGSDPVVDGVEITEARWFSRADLAADLERGAVRLPPTVSISRRLIEGWYGEPLPGSW